MKSKVLLVALALLGVVVAFRAAAQPRKPAGDDKEIQAAAAAFAAAFNKGDVNAMLAFWTDDADYTDDSGTHHKGKPAIAAMLKNDLPLLKGHTMKIEIGTVKFTRPDVAVEEGKVTITMPEGDSESNRYIAIWVKDDGKWLLNNVRDLPNVDGGDAKAEPLKDLTWLIGEWAHASENVQVTLKCRWALSKQFIVMEYEVTRKGAETSQVVQWVGWDPAADQVRSWVFDSEGGNGQADWERDGNTWTSSAVGVLSDRRTGTAINSIQFVDENHFFWRSKNREVDGEPVADAEVKFERAGTAKPKDAAKEEKR